MVIGELPINERKAFCSATSFLNEIAVNIRLSFDTADKGLGTTNKGGVFPAALSLGIS